MREEEERERDSAEKDDCPRDWGWDPVATSFRPPHPFRRRRRSQRRRHRRYHNLNQEEDFELSCEDET